MSAFPRARPLSPWRLAACLLVCAVAALGLRFSAPVRVAATSESSGWRQLEEPGFYHARRVMRALDEGRIAGRDPLLASPEFDERGGAPVFWPPYYDAGLALFAAPWAPAEARGRAAYVERLVGSVPALLGALTCVLLAWAAGRLAGGAAALGAGLYFACALAGLRDSAWGIGGHAAAAGLVSVSLLTCAGRALEPARRARRGRVMAAGIGLGALIAALVGTWVPGLLCVLPVTVALLLAQLRGEDRRGAALLGLMSHLSGALLLAPAVLSSPLGRNPLLSLSWLHVGLLLLGATFYVPALLHTRWQRLEAGLVIVPSAIFLFVALQGPAREARALLDVSGLESWTTELGYGVWALLLAGPVAGWAVARGRWALLPFLVAIPWFAALAVADARFASPLCAATALLLGWAAGVVTRALFLSQRTFSAGLVSVLSVASHSGALGSLAGHPRPGLAPAPELVELGARRAALLDQFVALEEGGVLAPGAVGHELVWRTGRPTVSSGFGRAVSDASTLDPWRGLLAEAEHTVCDLLGERGARYLWVPEGATVPADLTGAEESSLLPRLRAGPEEKPLLPRLRAGPEENSLLRRLRAGAGDDPQNPLHHLRQVLVGDVAAEGGARGRVYEAVEGALLQAAGDPGQTLEVEVRWSFPEEELVWRGAAPADLAGRMELRIPYGTVPSHGNGLPRGEAKWSLGERHGEVKIPEKAVLRGLEVRIR